MASYPRSLARSGQARSPTNSSFHRAARGTAFVVVLLVILITTAGRVDALVVPSRLPVPTSDAPSSQRPPVLDLVTVALLRERLPRALALVIDRLVDLGATFDPGWGEPMVPGRVACKISAPVDEAMPRRLVRLPKPSRSPLGLLGGGVRPDSADPSRVTIR